MKSLPLTLILLSAPWMLTACKTISEPEAPPIVIAPEPVRTCSPISELKRVVIPAETKTVVAITEIDNPPYEPIQRKETQTRIVTPEKVIYVDDERTEITDICPPEDGAS